jgi:hypothetical protein
MVGSKVLFELVRRASGWQELNDVEIKLKLQDFGDNQVPNMNRVERAAQNSNAT